MKNIQLTLRRTIAATVCAFSLASACINPVCFAGYESASTTKPDKPSARVETTFVLNDYVSYVNNRYNLVRKIVHDQSDIKSTKLKVCTDVALDVAEGKRIRLSIAKGVDDMEYSRQFTYDTDEKMVFCYYEISKVESYRMYFYNDELVEVIYKNEKTGVSETTRLEDAQTQYADWASYALYEAYYYPELLGY